MKFDFCIGNPPYQEPKENTSDKSVYNDFMDAAYQVADRVELITPARFLFNAGKTPKSWNDKMLTDNHLKVFYYEQLSGRVFPNTNITGGIAITYRDSQKHYGAIGAFCAFNELNSILRKVSNFCGFTSLMNFIFLQNKFNLESLYKDFPSYKDIIGSNGREKRLTSSIFSQLDVFVESPNNHEAVRILGLLNNTRVYRYISEKYLLDDSNLKKYKVFVPSSNGASGMLGESPARIISRPVLGFPGDGMTQTFIGIGSFDSQDEARNLFKYIHTKFARVMLGVLKVTQNNNAETWAYVPMQDFTSSSDIDWSVSIANIDEQLYKKYNFSKEEIDFIESHVKEME